MPHIHTDPGQHDATATAFIVRYKNDVPCVLLHMHRKFGKLMPPGGHIELHETPWAAMIHELEEESGYTSAELDILQPKLRMKQISRIVLHPQPFVSNTHAINEEHYHTDLSYVFIADDAPVKLPAEGESTDLRWLSAEDIKNLSGDATWQNVREMCEFIFNTLLPSHEWEHVPVTDFSLESPAFK